MSSRARIAILAAVTSAWLALMMAVGPAGRPLDTRWHWTSIDAHDYLEQIGADGREAYLRMAALDLVFAVLYTWLFLTILRAVERGLGEPARIAKLLGIGLVFPAYFDLIETTSLLGLISSFPNPMQSVANIAGWATTFKWCATALGISGILYRIYLLRQRPGTVSPAI